MVRYFHVNGVQSLLHDDWVSLDASDSLQLDEYRPLRMYLKYSLFQFITAMMNSSTVGFPKWIYRHNASSLCFGLFKSCKKKKIIIMEDFRSQCDTMCIMKYLLVE